jgi:hypothetical protein
MDRFDISIISKELGSVVEISNGISKIQKAGASILRLFLFTADGDTRKQGRSTAFGTADGAAVELGRSSCPLCDDVRRHFVIHKGVFFRRI